MPLFVSAGFDAVHCFCRSFHIIWECTLYGVFVHFVFIIFLWFRYRKETAFYKSLKTWENNLDVTAINEPETPFEAMVERSIAGQTEHLKQTAARHRLALENEKMS